MFNIIDIKLKGVLTRLSQNFQKLSEKKGKVGWINRDFSGGAVLNFWSKKLLGSSLDSLLKNSDACYLYPTCSLV